LLSSFLLWIISLCLVATGLFGILFPALPGAPLIFLGLVLASWIDNFERVGSFLIIILGVLTFITFVIDIFSSILGAKKFGASKAALWGAAIGGILGIFGGILGIFLGPLIGAAIGEFLTYKNLYRAGQIGLVTGIATVVGAILKIGIGISMIVLFLMSYFL
jgi:uncharacterized protein YqgC (DUF456 family)